jgi:transposase
VGHLDTTSFHVDGRYNSAEAPEAQLGHLTPGSSRAHRPDLNPVVLELSVEHQAGIPVLMTPLSGNPHDGVAFGQVITEHVQQLHTTRQVTSLVADSALHHAENLSALAASGLKREVLAQSKPSTMPPLTDG